MCSKQSEAIWALKFDVLVSFMGHLRLGSLLCCYIFTIFDRDWCSMVCLCAVLQLDEFKLNSRKQVQLLSVRCLICFLCYVQYLTSFCVRILCCKTTSFYKNVLVVLLCVVQGENVIREIFPKKVTELNALLEVICITDLNFTYRQRCTQCIRGLLIMRYINLHCTLNWNFPGHNQKECFKYP